MMEKFYENSDFAIYTDKKNEIVDLYNKVTDRKTRFMADTLDEAIIDTVSNEVLLKAKQAIDVELNRRIDRGDFKWLKNLNSYLRTFHIYATMI